MDYVRRFEAKHLYTQNIINVYIYYILTMNVQRLEGEFKIIYPM